MDWKNTMATDHTAGEPPRMGRIMRVNIGCTANSRKALVKMAAVNTARISLGCDAVATGCGRDD